MHAWLVYFQFIWNSTHVCTLACATVYICYKIIQIGIVFFSQPHSTDLLTPRSLEALALISLGHRHST